MRWNLLALMISVAILIAGSAAAQKPAEQLKAPTESKVAATVNGQPIAELAVQRALRREPLDKMTPAERAEARKSIIDMFIDNKLIDQYLLEQKIAVDPKEVQAKFSELEKDLKQQNMEYAQFLKEYELTDAEVKNEIAAALRIEKYIKGRVTDVELRKLFDDNKDLFNGTQVRARYILLTPDIKDAKAVEAAKTTLLQIKSQVAAAGDAAVAQLPPDANQLEKERARSAAVEDAFAKAATENSVCPTKIAGGDLPWFPRESPLDEKLAETAFNLKPFTMSDIVISQSGYSIMLMTGKREGQPVQYEKIRDAVQDVYKARHFRTLVPQLRQKAKITVDSPK